MIWSYSMSLRGIFMENSEIVFMMPENLRGSQKIFQKRYEKINFKRFGRFPENCSIECNIWNRSATRPWLISHLLSLEMPYAQLFRPTFQEKNVNLNCWGPCDQTLQRDVREGARPGWEGYGRMTNLNSKFHHAEHTRIEKRCVHQQIITLHTYVYIDSCN